MGGEAGARDHEIQAFGLKAFQGFLEQFGDAVGGEYVGRKGDAEIAEHVRGFLHGSLVRL